MALVAKTLMLDITPGAIPQVVNVSEYDENREYTVTLIDEGGTYEVPSGTTATIEGTIGGNGFSEAATVSGNAITFTLTESMTAWAGNAWCKIKLVKDSKPIQTAAFILRCDRAGVEAKTIINAPGFQEQINQGVAEYFDNDPPFFELPSGGQSGQALLSDGSNGAYWGDVQSGGAGLSDDAKAALLACFRNVAWVGSDGQSYYDDLHDALYPPAPPATLLSISAVFNQGSAVIYDTDDLNTLRQYLVVTATMKDSTTQTVTNYTLSGTLAVGTSTITVSYGGKSATFNVTVTESLLPSEYQQVEYIEATGQQYFRTGIAVGSSTMKILAKYYKQTQATKEEGLLCGESGGPGAGFEIGFTSTANRLFAFSATTAQIVDPLVYGHVNEIEVDFNPSSPYATIKLTNGTTELSASKTTANNPAITQSQLTLFYTGNVNTACSARLYYCKVYKDTNILAFDGIPCYRKNDNIAGMYDTVSGTFFSSTGTAQFIKGGDV